MINKLHAILTIISNHYFTFLIRPLCPTRKLNVSILYFRIESIPQCLEHLLAALNCLLRTLASDCRGQVCAIGEDLFPIFIQMWKKKHSQLQKVDNFLWKFFYLKDLFHYQALNSIIVFVNL